MNGQRFILIRSDISKAICRYRGIPISSEISKAMHGRRGTPIGSDISKAIHGSKGIPTRSVSRGLSPSDLTSLKLSKDSGASHSDLRSLISKAKRNIPIRSQMSGAIFR